MCLILFLVSLISLNPLISSHTFRYFLPPAAISHLPTPVFSPVSRFLIVSTLHLSSERHRLLFRVIVHFFTRPHTRKQFKPTWNQNQKSFSHIHQCCNVPSMCPFSGFLQLAKTMQLWIESSCRVELWRRFLCQTLSFVKGQTAWLLFHKDTALSPSPFTRVGAVLTK